MTAKATDPAQPAPTPAEPAPTSAEEYAATQRRRGRIAGIVGASFVGVIGIVILLAGAALIGVNSLGKDSDGYYTTGEEQLDSSGYAVTTENIDLGGIPSDFSPDDSVGKIRLRATGAGDAPVFIGIARTADVDRYLGGVRRSELIDFGNGEPDYRAHGGGAPRGLPQNKPFWVAKSQGAGRQAVEWDLKGGVWSVVVMNADGARGISVEADAGAKFDWLLWIGIGVAAIGLLLIAGAGTGMFLSLRKG